MEHNFEANFFTLLELLDAANRIEVESVCVRVSVPANTIVYQQGDQAKTVYIVASGVFEAVTISPDGQQTRSLGYMRRGDFFGDLGVLTGQTRLAAVRSCEDSQLLQIEKSVYLQLLEKIPRMGAYFSKNLARRLYKTTTQAHLNAYTVDLSGNLRHFDLLVIFHAIANAKKTGELQLNNSSNELIGSFFFKEGQAEHARYIHLEGVEAIWESFIESGTDGTFTFRVAREPILPFHEEYRIDLASDNLLTQGLAHREAFLALPEHLRFMEESLHPLTGTLAWSDVATAELAGHIWEFIAKRPQPLSSLWRRVNYSSITFLTIVSQLVASGQAELLPVALTEVKPQA